MWDQFQVLFQELDEQILCDVEYRSLLMRDGVTELAQIVKGYVTARVLKMSGAKSNCCAVPLLCSRYLIDGPRLMISSFEGGFIQEYTPRRRVWTEYVRDFMQQLCCVCVF